MLPVRAVEGDWGLKELQEATPESAGELMGELEPSGDFSGSLQTILYNVRATLWDRLREELRFAPLLFSLALLSAFAELCDFSGRAADAVRLASVLSIASLTVTELNSYTDTALRALQELSDYSRALLPVLAGTASLTGAVGSAAAVCAATALAMDALLTLATELIAPAICGFAALSIADAAVGNPALKSVSSLMENVCTLALTGIATVFTLWQSLITTVSGSGEAAAVKATKSILSVGLPVVGKLLSAASSSLSAAGGMVKATAGVFGLTVVLALCIGPFLALGCRYLLFRLTACLCSCFAESSVAGLLENLSSAFALLLGLLGTSALCLFVSIWSLMRLGV